jgi:hypothetical protein
MAETAARTPDRRTFLFFAWFSLAVVAFWTALLRGTFYAEHPSLAAAGVAIDLAITLPLVWYFAAVRRGKAPPATLVPVIVFGLVAAHIMTPGESPPMLLVLVGLAEIGIATTVVIRVRRAMRNSSGSVDPLERIETFALELVPSRRAAKMMASEIGVFWYTFLSWKKEPPKGEGVRRWAKVEDWTGVMIGFLVVIVAEAVGLHLWLMTKWPNAIWLLTLSDLYAIVWLIADARALSLSAVKWTDDTLHIRFGMRWRAEVPRDHIESIEPVSGDDEQWDLKLALIEEPDTLVTFRKPVTFHGPYGFTKQAKSVGILVEGLG